MKLCPKCDRSYADETLNFCLEDGEWLVDDQAGEPATAIIPGSSPSLRSADLSSEPATNARINTTNQTAVLPAALLPDLQPRQTSSAEYIIDEVKGHKRALAITAAVIVIAVAGIGYWLFRTRAAGDTAPISSIAVLPFQNKSSDADTDYLSDGLAESLVFRLSQLPNLKVSPTSSVIRYKGKDNDPTKVASELGVDAVMSGRMVQRGDGLMISVELVDARNNTLLWGEQYDRKMSDLLATQREIAATIVQKLQLKLIGNEKGITKKYTDNNDAYQLYLKGRFHFARRSQADIRQSIDLFEQAIKLDPKFALAYVGIGESWAVMPSYPYMEPKDAMPLAKDAIAKALAIDPDLPEAHTVAGMIAATYDWDWAKAESEFKRSLELDPNLAITHYRYAWTYLSPMGRHEEAIAEMNRAMELEPLSLVQGANFAAIYIYARQYDKALDQARKTYDMDPTLVTGQNWMCHSLDVNARYTESLAISEKSYHTNGSLYAALSYSYAKLGRRQDAERVLKEWDEPRTTNSVSHYWKAITYAALGDKDTAIAELEKAHQAHDWFFQRIKIDPFLDTLRTDPRFDDLVRRLGLP
jgi:adenylate cyclase